MASEDIKLVGLYVHQHWPYRHPYCARTWSTEDWLGYAGALKRLGFNTILFWPMLETIPDPPTPSDTAQLDKLAGVIDGLHELGLRVLLALCPNVAPDDAKAAQATFEKRHFFACDTRIDPGDPAALARLLARRETLLAPLRAVDGVCIIDSDPGGYPGSTNQEFVLLLTEHRKLFDLLRPGIELIYWMHAGWLGYNRFYETGVLGFSTDEENLDVLRRLIAADPAPWGLANGLPLAEQLGIADRVISYNYGRIEGEPSFPQTNFGGDGAWQAGASPGPRGVMGNAQTHCVQLPNTFAFARGAQGLPVAEADYVAFADELLTGQGAVIVAAWSALAGDDAEAMRRRADELAALPDEALAPGPLGGLLFGNPRRFVTDLVMMLRLRAAFVELRDGEGAPRERVRAFTATATMWQATHGYENSWWWPDLAPTLRRIGSPAVDAVLDSAFNPFEPPPAGIPGTPFEQVAYQLWHTESYTTRLLAALREAAQ